MSAWHTGGNYSRPITRRLVEEAGVPREDFGKVKSFASRWFLSQPEFLTASSSVEYGNWLRDAQSMSTGAKKNIPKLNQKFEARQINAARWLVNIIGKTPGSNRLRLLKRWPFKQFKDIFFEDVHEVPWLPRSRLLIFPWTIHRTKRSLYAAVEDSPEMQRTTCLPKRIRSD